MKISKDLSILDYFYHWEKETPENVFLKQPVGDDFIDYNFKNAGEQIRKISTFINSLGLPPQSNIALISKNCPEWIITDLAIMHSGHISVPLYPTLIAHQVGQILEHADCPLVFIGKLDDWASMKDGIPKTSTVVSFPRYNPDPSHLQWDDLLQKHDADLKNYRPDLSELCTIIYTSGTTGNPKGVMVNFGSFSECIAETKHISLAEMKGARFFSY